MNSLLGWIARRIRTFNYIKLNKFKTKVGLRSIELEKSIRNAKIILVATWRSQLIYKIIFRVRLILLLEFRIQWIYKNVARIEKINFNAAQINWYCRYLRFRAYFTNKQIIWKIKGEFITRKYSSKSSMQHKWKFGEISEASTWINWLDIKKLGIANRLTAEIARVRN
jgi:hypothetical protein